ncbi:helix-turn-helix domain-containing protein [Streptomyces mirabilis]|uniref:helix-turn-helix domain-containing protein n=1 Tax=Streptomyces mirabilis TaxID=68239 RepID=UPI003637EBF1
MNGERSAGVRARAGGQRPLSDEVRARIIALAEQELSVRQIAAEVGCSTGSVSTVCRLAGVQLDRRRTQTATRARQVQAAAVRAELSDELLAMARDELLRLRRPHTEYWGVGGKEPTVLSVAMPEPPPRARRDLIGGAMALLDKHLRLVETDRSSTDHSDVDQWLASLTGGGER